MARTPNKQDQERRQQTKKSSFSLFLSLCSSINSTRAHKQIESCRKKTTNSQISLDCWHFFLYFTSSSSTLSSLSCCERKRRLALNLEQQQQQQSNHKRKCRRQQVNAHKQITICQLDYKQLANWLVNLLKQNTS